MFGWLRRSAQQVQEARAQVAAQAATDAQQMFMRLQGALGGLSPDMPEDPFLVGAVATHAAILTKVLSNGQAPLAVAEAAMVQAMQLAFGTVGVDRIRALGLLHQYKNHPDYTKASQVITLVLAARFARKDLLGDPIILNARERVRAMPQAFRQAFGSTEEEQVAEQLCQELFVRPMKAKYGELWKRGAA